MTLNGRNGRKARREAAASLGMKESEIWLIWFCWHLRRTWYRIRGIRGRKGEASK